jgi:hypothetical protein
VEVLRRTTNYLRIIGVSVYSGTLYVPNTNQKRYCWIVKVYTGRRPDSDDATVKARITGLV